MNSKNYLIKVKESWNHFYFHPLYYLFHLHSPYPIVEPLSDKNSACWPIYGERAENWVCNTQKSFLEPRFLVIFSGAFLSFFRANEGRSISYDKRRKKKLLGTQNGERRKMPSGLGKRARGFAIKTTTRNILRLSANTFT